MANRTEEENAELREIVNRQQVLLERQAELIRELRQELALANLENVKAFHCPSKASNARMEKVSSEERIRIAKLGAEARWAKKAL
jgi:hypothetical protein